MALNGSLGDFSALETLQVVGLQRKTGTLTFESGRERREIHLLDGDLIGCRPSNGESTDPLLRALAGFERCQPDETRFLQSLGGGDATEAILRATGLDLASLREIQRAVLLRILEEVLLWERGTFRFTPRPIAPLVSEEPWNVDQALLEAMRRLDELPDLKALGLGSETVPRICVPAAKPSPGPWRGLSIELLEQVLRLSDGHRTVREIRELLGISDWDLMQAVRDLGQRGILALESRRPRPEPAPPRFGERQRPRSPAFALGLAVLIAGVLGIGAAAGRIGRLSSAQADHAAALERQAFERERDLRYALEARRLRSGRYPDSLDRLIREDLWPASRAEELDGFAYESSGSGYVLSEPGPWRTGPVSSAPPDRIHRATSSRSSPAHS